MSSAEACCSKARCAHDVRAQRRVADIGGVVDRFRQLVDDVHVLAERRPVPGDRSADGFGGDVFGADDVAQNHVALLGRAGREREAAVAHDGGRDAVPAGAASERIPEDLRVHVRVPVDETGRDDLAGRVDLFFAFFANAPDRRDTIAAHADVGSIFGSPVPSTTMPLRITRSCMSLLLLVPTK